MLIILTCMGSCKLSLYPELRKWVAENSWLLFYKHLHLCLMFHFMPLKIIRLEFLFAQLFTLVDIWTRGAQTFS